MLSGQNHVRWTHLPQTRSQALPPSLALLEAEYLPLAEVTLSLEPQPLHQQNEDSVPSTDPVTHGVSVKSETRDAMAPDVWDPRMGAAPVMHLYASVFSTAGFRRVGNPVLHGRGEARCGGQGEARVGRTRKKQTSVFGASLSSPGAMHGGTQ